MSQERAREQWRRPADAPSGVEITIVPDPAARPFRERIGRTSTALRRLGLAGLVLVVAVMGSWGVGALSGGGASGGGASGGPAAAPVNYSCLVRSLPRAVQVQLGVCH
jgi:hypothetical protein